jgi:hypothetical protein
MGAEGLEPHGYNAGKTALSEKPGAQAGAIDSDSDSQGQFANRALADLHRVWLTLRQWEAAALPRDAKRVQSLRGGLAMLMKELEALTADSE